MVEELSVPLKETFDPNLETSHSLPKVITPCQTSHSLPDVTTSCHTSLLPAKGHHSLSDVTLPARRQTPCHTSHSLSHITLMSCHTSHSLSDVTTQWQRGPGNKQEQWPGKKWRIFQFSKTCRILELDLTTSCTSTSCPGLVQGQWTKAWFACGGTCFHGSRVEVHVFSSFLSDGETNKAINGPEWKAKLPYRYLLQRQLLNCQNVRIWQFW